MYNPFSLEGRHILITGASSGIGRQCAIDCSRMGARITLVARDETRLHETLSQMEGEGHACYSFDLSRTEYIGTLVTEAVSLGGKFDGFVHAAGIEMTKPIKLLTPNDYEQVYRINAISGFELVRHLTNVKNFNKSGAIALISSITSTIARTGVAAYSASKGAMVSVAKVMALELARKNIRVNTISPGTILTSLMQNYLSTLDQESYKARLSGFPLGLGKTSDISSTVIFLLSDASRWITGQNFIVDGGYTAQ